jgi:hypothetical protein
MQYKMQNKETRVHKITHVPVFYMAIGLNDFDAGKLITRPLKGVGHENLDFFGPKWHSLRLLPFQVPKKF